MTTQQFQQTQAIVGQRWDQLSDAFYLDPYGYARIIEANIATLGYPVMFQGGEVIDIPEEPETDVQVNLPPWRR